MLRSNINPQLALINAAFIIEHEIFAFHKMILRLPFSADLLPRACYFRRCFRRATYAFWNHHLSSKYEIWSDFLARALIVCHLKSLTFCCIRFMNNVNYFILFAVLLRHWNIMFPLNLFNFSKKFHVPLLFFQIECQQRKMALMARTRF